MMSEVIQVRFFKNNNNNNHSTHTHSQVNYTGKKISIEKGSKTQREAWIISNGSKMS